MAAALPAKMDPARFRRLLLAWFDASKRDLPWRRSSEPYAIWVSEIMLQQTRVAAVLEHYARFMERFGSIVALALAREDEVLAVWSGLGYYRRAKLLHRAAQFIVREHQGSLPHTAEELRKLPGIGGYTAAAIASIAFGEAVAVVDGNVQRVIQRVFQPVNGQPEERVNAQWIRGHADALLARGRPGDFNQAMMELGAMVCLPKNPMCLMCPVQAFCATRGEHIAAPRKPMRSRQIAYALLCRNTAGMQQVLLEQRPEGISLMAGMWELPEVEMREGDQERVELTLRHAITVTNYYVRILRFRERDGKRRLAATERVRKWIRTADLANLPLTGLARKALQRVKIMPVQPVSIK